MRRLWLRGLARAKEVASSFTADDLNLSWVTDSLAVGGAFEPGHESRLASLGIQAVLDLREEALDDADALAQHGIELLHLPVRDGHAHAGEELAEGAEWVVARLAEGKKVLIHCQHGVGRSPLLACAALVRQGASASAALNAVRARRWQASPNDRQLEALLAFERMCREAKADA